MVRPAALSLVLLLAACGRGDDEIVGEEVPGPAPAESRAAAEPGPQGVQPGPVVAAAPETAGAPAFTGRWAAQPNLCEGGAWSFTADSVATAGGSQCDFREVVRTAAGWRVAATCTAEGPPTDAELDILQTDPASADAITVSGGPFQPVALRRCP